MSTQSKLDNNGDVKNPLVFNSKQVLGGTWKRDQDNNLLKPLCSKK